MIGANVTWRNDAGWGLSLLAFDGAAFGGPSSAGGDVTIQRVSGLDFWTTSAWDRCIVDVDELSEAGVTGSATCRGLRWVDGMSGFGAVGGPGEPAYIEGQEPFDAELTFEAH